MNWAFLFLRIAIGVSILVLLFLSQRFWYRALWRATSNWKNTALRVAARLAYVVALLLVILATSDSFRMAHGHLLPRGTTITVLAGLWLSSAVFGFLAVKLVKAFDRLWTLLRRAYRATRPPVSVAGIAASPVNAASPVIATTPRNATIPINATTQLKTTRVIPTKPVIATSPAIAATQASAAAVEILADPSRRYFFRAVTAAAGAAPFLGAMYGFAAERLNYQIHRVEIPIPGLPAGLEGLKIVQLSDIHLSSFMPSEQIHRAVDMANDLHADLAVLTGDYITGAGDPLPDCIDELRQLRAPLGTWGCNGNHEIYARAEDSAELLFHQAGMKLLRQENVQLTFHGAHFNLIGVDYQRERTRNGQKQQTLANIAPLVRRDVPNILLSHNPNSFHRAAELGIELSLAGHTHGGQIQVEILDHRLSPARFITDYIAGLYQRPIFAPAVPNSAVAGTSAGDVAGTSAEHAPLSAAEGGQPALQARSSAASSTAIAHLYVNRGLGTVGAPVRLGVPPEITLLTLRRA